MGKKINNKIKKIDQDYRKPIIETHQNINSCLDLILNLVEKYNQFKEAMHRVYKNEFSQKKDWFGKFIIEKEEFLKNWWQSMAVGNCLQLSTGSGWDVLQWKGWARPVPRLRGCPRPCGGGSGLVHAWNGPQGAAVAWLCWRGARGEGLRGGFVSLLVPKGALMQTSFACG